MFTDTSGITLPTEEKLWFNWLLKLEGALVQKFFTVLQAGSN